MSQPQLYFVAGAAVFALALHGLLTRAHLLRKILAGNLLGTALFMILIALARRTEPPDAVPHALVLTGIVVSVSTTAFALVLARRIHQETGQARLPEERGPR